MRLVESDYVMDERLVNCGSVGTFLLARADEEVGIFTLQCSEKRKTQDRCVFLLGVMMIKRPTGNI